MSQFISSFVRRLTSINWESNGIKSRNIKSIKNANASLKILFDAQNNGVFSLGYSSWNVIANNTPIENHPIYKILSDPIYGIRKSELFDDAIKNGGLTVNKSGLAVEFKKGYQVSKKDCFIISIDKKAECLKAIKNILDKITNDEFCGLWIAGGKLYADISINILNRKKAVEMGEKLKQVSIFDWATKSCINLK